MDKIRITYFICWIIVLTLVNISWQIKNEKVARFLLGIAIELTFMYCAFYGGMMG